eukprot:TRINITY_DN5234_c0_g1_i2.p1 TRINITY_DN5234_c0_g1~~TRINITY_DN5234_c0_g1_i2.p1  ORF type:complete len:302 (+),score=45.18 TRINITY_DN5234_c0_g1_i2:56-961(+)
MLDFANAMLLLASAAVSCSGSPCEGLDCSDGMSSVSLLQTQIDTYKTDFRCAPIEKIWDEDGRYQLEGICGNMDYKPVLRDVTKYYPGSSAEKELERPLIEIRKEHGTEDLFNHFGLLNDWINPSSAFPPNSTYESLKQSLMTSSGTHFPTPVEMTFKWDGNEIQTQQDHVCQAGDDPYCFANGWMKNQNLELLPPTFNDPEAYTRFAQDQCRQMNEKYHFDQDNITMLSHLRETNSMYEMSDNACSLMPTKGALPTNRDFQKHAFVKCLMNDAKTEIAYCYFRGCTLEGNRIGHGDECDY